MNVLIVGAGGIGSWLAFFLDDLVEKDQFSDETTFTFADDDIVDVKNTAYQNFPLEDISEYKVESIQTRYLFESFTGKVEDIEFLKPYDVVVSAVDNTVFRRMLFENEPQDDYYWIDLRSEGNQVSAYSKGADKEMLLNTVKETVEGASCQRQFELDNGIIQNGNKIIAAIGSQMLLNYYRGEMNKKQFNTIF